MSAKSINRQDTKEGNQQEEHLDLPHFFFLLLAARSPPHGANMAFILRKKVRQEITHLVITRISYRCFVYCLKMTEHRLNH